MKKSEIQKPDYGNWVSKKLLFIPGIVALFFIGLSFISYFFLIGTIIILIPFTYFLYAYCKFTPKGGDIQTRIRNLVFDYINWNENGKILDIGCGNGALAIEAAIKYGEAQVTGIDCWGEMWDYSRDACEKNAKVVGVADRVTFQKASAANLPFEDGAFDVVISNFVFHEVQEAGDKRDVLKEALRVVKPGGTFVFQDLFMVRKIYGEPEELLETVRLCGIREVHLVDTSKSAFIPGALKLPFMVGSIGIIYGTK
jgi:SAM-dependent methyltransferase